MMRGVVITLIMASTLLATTSPKKEKSVSETLQSLFDGLEPDSSSYFSVGCFIDLENLLEECPELAQEFKDLTVSEKEGLIQTLEMFNKACADVLDDLLVDNEHSSQSLIK